VRHRISRRTSLGLAAKWSLLRQRGRCQRVGQELCDNMFIACELRSKLPDQVIAGILSGRAHHFDASFLATRRPYLFSTWICSAPQCAAFGCIVDRRASRDTAQAFRRCRVFLVRITVETMACTAQFRSACMNITPFAFGIFSHHLNGNLAWGVSGHRLRFCSFSGPLASGPVGQEQ
jgi:hypothetical protein